jgi:DNA-binding transcriptional regulator YdaS (Cro superfamily)
MGELHPRFPVRKIPIRVLQNINRAGKIVSMDFKTFWLSMSVTERKAFALRCDASVFSLRNIAYGKPCGDAIAINIERESGGKVSCEALCPTTDWAYIRQTGQKKAA